MTWCLFLPPRRAAPRFVRLENGIYCTTPHNGDSCNRDCSSRVSSFKPIALPSYCKQLLSSYPLSVLFKGARFIQTTQEHLWFSSRNVSFFHIPQICDFEGWNLSLVFCLFLVVNQLSFLLPLFFTATRKKCWRYLTVKLTNRKVRKMRAVVKVFTFTIQNFLIQSSKTPTFRYKLTVSVFKGSIFMVANAIKIRCFLRIGLCRKPVFNIAFVAVRGWPHLPGVPLRAFKSLRYALVAITSM